MLRSSVLSQWQISIVVYLCLIRTVSLKTFAIAQRSTLLNISTVFVEVDANLQEQIVCEHFYELLTSCSRNLSINETAKTVAAEIGALSQIAVLDHVYVFNLKGSFI